MQSRKITKLQGLLYCIFTNTLTTKSQDALFPDLFPREIKYQIHDLLNGNGCILSADGTAYGLISLLWRGGVFDTAYCAVCTVHMPLLGQVQDFQLDILIVTQSYPDSTLAEWTVGSYSICLVRSSNGGVKDPFPFS